MLQYTTPEQEKRLKELGFMQQLPNGILTAHARKWLLEKHDVYVEVSPLNGMKPKNAFTKSPFYWEYIIHHINKQENQCVKVHSSKIDYFDFDTAEEKGLDYALSIIKLPNNA